MCPCKTFQREVTMTDSLRDAALRAAVWQTIEARAKELKDEARAELAAIPVGETVAAKWDGRLLAKASLAKGKTKLVVTDETKLLEWVKDNHPTELVTTVNKAYLSSLEARAKELGIDAAGDVIPGVEIVTGEPTVTVRKEKDGLAIVADLLGAGRVSLDGLNTKAIENVIDGEVVDRWTEDMEAGAIG